MTFAGWSFSIMERAPYSWHPCHLAVRVYDFKARTHNYIYTERGCQLYSLDTISILIGMRKWFKTAGGSSVLF